ncbi:MAG TPA: enoyl-CoA hydratase/isomerase family protein, partial [bacterium]|nr:enoyl-CoA hydratase/isomerase family protein [bacterium]
MYETLLADTQGGARILTLNRPDVLNAINAQMGEELNEALRDAERSPEVRCVLLTAAGRGFCAGADLREQSPGHTKVGDLLRTRYNRMVAKIRAMEKP